MPKRHSTPRACGADSRRARRSRGSVEWADLHVYNLTTMAWTELTANTTGPQPEGRDSMVWTAVGDSIVMFGGWDANYGEPSAE